MVVAVALPNFFDGTPMVSNADAMVRSGEVASKLRRQGVRVLRARINALLGVAPGSLMTASVVRVEAVAQPAPDATNGAAGANGGLIPIVTDYSIGRNTTVNDAVQVATILRDRVLGDMLDYTTTEGQTNGLRVVGDGGLGGPLLGIDFILGEDELG